MSKNNENKLVPKLRFPEFEDIGDWKIEPLNELSYEINEKTKGRKYKLMSITSGVGLVSQLEKFGREIAGNSYSNYYVINKGDFAYNKSSTKLYPEGEIALLENEEQGAVPNSIFTCFGFKKNKVYPLFAKYPFINNLHGRWLRKFIAVGARANGALQVNTKDLFSIPFPYPSIPEQQKIAACLSSLDDVITAESQKLELLKEHKKGLLQNLFPQEGETVPKLRFKEFEDSEEWEVKKLGEMVDTLMGNAFKSEDFVENGTQLVRMGNLYQGELQLNRSAVFLPNNYQEKYSKFLIEPFDILMSMTGTMGKRDYGFVVQIPKKSHKLLLNQRVLKIIPKPNYFKEFILHLLRHEIFLEKLYSSPGGTKQANLSVQQLNGIIITVPKYKEQQKIASCLSSLDDLITTQSQKVEALKLHKRGLLQGLFPDVNTVNE